jgi:hypothetical protein
MLQTLLHFRFVIAAALFGLLVAAIPGYASAQEATTPEDDRCTSCHSDEGEAWMASPHGVADPNVAGQSDGASCVDCHGPYIKGHPEEGTIQLSIASELCQDCHTDIYDQWMHTQHAGEGVQCISCHKPHSQELRLTDETLCQSCHREGLTDSLHIAHVDSDVTCTNCHMNGPTLASAVASTDAAAVPLHTPSHDFTLVSADNCLDCHREQVKNEDATVRLPAPVKIATRTDSKSATPWILSAANLGFGLGMGGVVGILFMLVAGTVFGRREQ